MVNDLIGRFGIYFGPIPIAGDYIRGDRTYFDSPSAGSFIGAVCTSSGNPGVWKNFGPINP
jgi:hypothetical protein